MFGKGGPTICRSYLYTSALCFILIGACAVFFPHLTPFGFFEFWTIKGSLKDAAWQAWPIYLFGILFNLKIFFRRNDYRMQPRQLLLAGFGISLWAGVAEEICFRWLIFMGAIVVITGADWLLLGFMGVHPVQWFYGILCIVANFFTFGYLAPYLLNGFGWAVGAAIISSNGRFRNGHAYQGYRGFTISWFMGMYFFWLMFTYGLLAAMLVHFLYDFFLFLLAVLDATIEKGKRGW